MYKRISLSKNSSLERGIEMAVKEYMAQLEEKFPLVEMKKGFKSTHPKGNEGLVQMFPKSEEEISAILQHAMNTEKSVVVEGNGSKKGFGGEIEQYDLLLSLQHYKGIVEHAIADMTITLRAGTNFKEVQTYLETYDQQIAIDPFIPCDATIGGVIASNDSGPKRLGYGSARDSVIGLRVAYPNGTVIRTGGKVVKNVAGYDMNKLFIGSMGTLGVITEVTLRLAPLPKKERIILFTFDQHILDPIRKFSERILDSYLEPVSLELLSPSLANHLLGEENYALLTSFEDVESSVNDQEKEVQKLCKASSSVTILKEKEDIHNFWNALYHLQNTPVNELKRELRSNVKVCVKNLDVLNVIEYSVHLQDRYHVTTLAHGGIGHGICQIYFSGSEQDVLKAISDLRLKVEELKGSTVIKDLPVALRKTIDVWGQEPSYMSLLKGIKRAIDSKNTLNEKRYVGGI